MKQKQDKNPLVENTINIVAIALIVGCFLCSMVLVRSYAEDNCLDRIEETTRQAAHMFTSSMDESREKLTVFADIIATNETNPDAKLEAYMETFCSTQHFTALCIHRANGSSVSYGDHPHDLHLGFDEDVSAVPYVSGIHALEENPSEKYIYQAIPIIKDGKIAALLYGYIPLSEIPDFVSTTAYDNNCQLYVVDGDTGDFLLDTWHQDMPLGNIYDGSMGNRETKKGHDLNQMRDGVRNGESGYFIFRSKTTGDWFYTYYMPLGINNWSIQLTIDEPTAFASYNQVNKTFIILSVIVIALMCVHVLILMRQTARTKQKDILQLQKSQYMYEVQKALLTAHHNPSYLEQALQVVGTQIQTEYVLLLTFSGNTINKVYCWPSADDGMVNHLAGKHIRNDFPTLTQLRSDSKGFFYDNTTMSAPLTDAEKTLFEALGMHNMMAVPIANSSGLLRGALCAVNAASSANDFEMLECITYDFFAAIANIENHFIIKHMGETDYLTGMKNRNSFEAETFNLTHQDCHVLWCAFIDVNGLHEVNNLHGHKAGDKLLCAVADAVRNAFGSRYSYRFGGDEFISFVFDTSLEVCQEKKKAILAELADKGYSVSIGFESVTKNDLGVFDLDRALAQAEAIMYRNKWKYYQENNISSEREHFPQLDFEF